MKILHISTLDEGGAASAAIRLHEAMLIHGYDSNFLSLTISKRHINNRIVYDGKYKKINELPSLTFKNLMLEKLFKIFSKKKENFKKSNLEKIKLTTPTFKDGQLSFTLFSYPNSIYDILSISNFNDYDIIHLHWVANFLDYDSFFKTNKKPVIWTFHDENPYLGGFHYHDDVDNNKDTHSLKEEEFIKIKKNIIRTVENITVISPSNWIALNAKQSEIFQNKRIRVIRYTLDSNIFQPRNRNFSRELFKLPKNKKIILVASQDLSIPRKGVRYINELINSIDHDEFIFVFAGINLKFKNPNVISVGSITDELLMSCLYSAADYFLLPSVIDNLPNTLLESLYCGTPVIAFKIGDFEELFKNNDFGVLVEPGNLFEIIDVLKKISIGELYFNSSKIVRNALNIFSTDKIVKEYITEYNYILNKSL